jgi:hypothetical protein
MTGFQPLATAQNFLALIHLAIRAESGQIAAQAQN